MLVQSITNHYQTKPCNTVKKNNTTAYATNTTILPSFVDAKCYANINFKAKIHDYAYNGNLDGVKRELQNGINVNIQDKKGPTPLHWACYKGHLDIVKYLIEQGADLNIQNNYGNASLHFACYEGHTDIVELLCEQKGIDVNIQQKDGWTPLYLACLKEHLDTVKYLCEQGADLNIQGKDGWAPLHKACYNGHSDIVKLLCEQEGINLTLKNPDGKTPLDIAKDKGYQYSKWGKELEEKTNYQLAHPETIRKNKPLSKKQAEKQAENDQTEINKLKQELTQEKQDYTTKIETLAKLLGQDTKITAENFEKLLKKAYSDQVLQAKIAELEEKIQTYEELMNAAKKYIHGETEAAKSGFRAIYEIQQDESVEKMGYAEQMARITKILLENKRKLQGTNDETPENIVKTLQDNNGKISNDGLEFINRIFKSCESVTADDLVNSIKSVKNESGYIDLEKVSLFLTSIAWGTAIKTAIEKVKTMPKIK